jgi:hypothetical protein
MKSVENRLWGPFRLPVVAIFEWLMVLPATVFLGAGALRMLQPRQYEPARSSWIIFEWTATHISRFGAAMLFAGMPGVVVIAGCATLLGNWRQDPALRQDAAITLDIVRRQLASGLLTAAVLLAGAILLVAGVHLVTD